MSVAVIKVEDLGKKYIIGHQSKTRQDTFRDTVINNVGGLLRKTKELVKGQYSVEGEVEEFWALSNINLTINQGDCVGIIGRNGAGKSTLLKILSRITEPTTGKISIKGRVASLLEVGTGFHPELTGRENVFLNGAIMGMRRTEIKRKFDEIVAFAEVEKFLDTPVKRYSSGMYVRLAFAVAAHLEPEILIVDEVLAVGDAEFQKKCMGKIGEVSKGEGRTVLFVSHNMMAIQNLCNNAVYLKNGHLVHYDEVRSTMRKYLEESASYNANNSIESLIKNLPEDETFELLKLRFDQNGLNSQEFKTSEDVHIQFLYRIKHKVEGLRIGFDVIDKETDSIVFRSFHDDDYKKIESFHEGSYSTTFILPKNFFKDKSYVFSISIGIHNKRWIVYNAMKIEVKMHNIDGQNKIYADNRPGLIMPIIKTETKILN
jgi:lipopolysaccharide transport system ATP-binding protein